MSETKLVVVYVHLDTSSVLHLQMTQADGFKFIEDWVAWKRGQGAYPDFQGGEGWAFESERVVAMNYANVDNTEQEARVRLLQSQAAMADEMVRQAKKDRKWENEDERD